MILAQFNPFRFFTDVRARVWDKLSYLDDRPEEDKSIIIYEAGIIPAFSVIIESDPQGAAPSVSAKVYNNANEEITTLDNFSTESFTSYATQLTVQGKTLTGQDDKYIYIKLTIDGTDYFSDMFQWVNNTDNLLKIEAGTAYVRVGGYKYSMLNTPIKFYLNAEPLTMKPKVDQTAIEQQAISNVYYGARAIPREFEIDANDSIYMFLSALEMIRVNGSVKVTFEYETWNASDIQVEETTAHMRGTYQLKLSFVDESETVGVVNG